MKTAKKGSYIEKFLKKADNALQDGVKKADEIIDGAVEIGIITAKQAKKTSGELHSQARKESKALHKKGIKKINEGITAAKNMTYNTQEDLELLKKLGELRESKVITEKEFQAKKKKILGRI